jgi:vacuolar-type H+-ATPase subunit E/Vma4
MNELFSSIERDQQKNGTVEPVRLFARQQFEKRLARISRAREQSVEQIYRSTESEEAAESEAEGPGLAGHNA